MNDLLKAFKEMQRANKALAARRVPKPHDGWLVCPSCLDAVRGSHPSWCVLCGHQMRSAPLRRAG